MYFYKAYGLTISSEIQLPELLPINPGSSYDIEIRKGDVQLPYLTRTSIHRRGVLAYFGKSGSSLFLSWKGVADFEAIGDSTLVVASHTSDTSVISLFTISEAFGLILFRKGYFLLHASAVVAGNKAYCFMGRPAAGKSSTAAAFLKAGARLLSDDLTAITFDDSGNPWVVPAYPQIKMWDGTVEGLGFGANEISPVAEGMNKFAYNPLANFPAEPVKLEKVFFLHKARNQPAERELSPMATPTEMLKHFPLPSQLLSEDVLKRHFVDSLRCAQSADVRIKRRPEGFDNLAGWVKAQISMDNIPNI